jgi:hypothetical protein
MSVLGFIFGLFALALAGTAMHRIRNLEKKLKQFDVIPRDFDSRNEPKEAEPE